MGILSVERIVADHSFDRRNSAVKVRGGVVVPRALAERIDVKIDQWMISIVNRLTGTQANLQELVASPNPNFPSGYTYLPGRKPINEQWKTSFETFIRLQLEKLNRQKRLPKKLNFIYEGALELILETSIRLKLPYLCVQSALGRIFDGILEQETGLDLFKEDKEETRAAIMESLASLSERLTHTIPPLFGAFELSILGNQFGIAGNPAYAEALRRGRLGSFMKNLWEIPVFYYVNDFVEASNFLYSGHKKSDVSAEAWQAIVESDLVILKGEGNLLGMPPENTFRKNLLHLFIAKNPLFFEGLSKFPNKNRDPMSGEAVMWFRQHEVNLCVA